MPSNKSVFLQKIISASVKFAFPALLVFATPKLSFAQTLKLTLQDQDQQPVQETRMVINGKEILLKESTTNIQLDLPIGSKVSFALSKFGYKDYSGAIRIKKDTTILKITLKKETILLPEVGITAGRLKNEQTKELFNALDYYLDDSVVLILGKVGSKAQLRWYDSNLKLKSIGALPFSDLKLLIDCNNAPVLYNDAVALGINLEKNKIQLTKDVTYTDIKNYLLNPCILKHNGNYFYRYTNSLKTTSIFYYYNMVTEESNIYFVSTNDELASISKNFVQNLYRNNPRYTTVDPENKMTPIELSESYESYKKDVTNVNDGKLFFKKVMLNANEVNLFYHSHQFHILDMVRMQYHSIDTGYTQCNAGSFAHLAGGGKWSKKFYTDVEYTRLFTTYVQGETKVVELKGEKLDESKTTATIPFNGYFPEKIKVMGSYLYYLMFDGKKRVLYRQPLEGY